MGKLHFEFSHFEFFCNFPSKNFDCGGKQKRAKLNLQMTSIKVVITFYGVKEVKLELKQRLIRAGSTTSHNDRFYTFRQRGKKPLYFIL